MRESTGVKITGAKRETVRFRPSAQLLAVFSHQTSATLTQKPEPSSQSRTCSWLHFLGIKMEPRQEFLITKYLASPCPRAGFWFFVFPGLKVTRTIPTTEHWVAGSFSQVIKGYRGSEETPRKIKNVTKAILKGGQEGLINVLGMNKEKCLLKIWGLFSSDHVTLGQMTIGRSTNHHHLIAYTHWSTDSWPHKLL